MVGPEYKQKTFAYPYDAFNQKVIKILEGYDIEIGLSYPLYQPNMVTKLEDVKDRCNVGISASRNGKACSIISKLFEKELSIWNIYIICLHKILFEQFSRVSN